MFSSAVEIPVEADRPNAFHSTLVQRTEENKGLSRESLLMNTHQFHISCLDVCSERASYNSVPLHLTSASAFH